MNRYKVVYLVDGKRTESIITANSEYDAKELIKKQYNNCRISFINCTYLPR